MRFLAIEPFFFNDQYYAASSEAPLAFDFPKDYVPNVRWYPLDTEALTSLEVLQKEIHSYGNRVVIHKIPQNIRLPNVIRIDAPPKVDPDAVPPSLALGQAVPTGDQQFTMSEIQSRDKGQVPQQHRPSDTEPRKR